MLYVHFFFFFFSSCTVEEGARNAQLLEKKKKRLEDDVDKYRKRLHDAEKCLKVLRFPLILRFSLF